MCGLAEGAAGGEDADEDPIHVADVGIVAGGGVGVTVGANGDLETETSPVVLILT